MKCVTQRYQRKHRRNKPRDNRIRNSQDDITSSCLLSLVTMLVLIELPLQEKKNHPYKYAKKDETISDYTSVLRMAFHIRKILIITKIDKFIFFFFFALSRPVNRKFKFYIFSPGFLIRLTLLIQNHFFSSCLFDYSRKCNAIKGCDKMLIRFFFHHSNYHRFDSDFVTKWLDMKKKKNYERKNNNRVRFFFSLSLSFCSDKTHYYVLQYFDCLRWDGNRLLKWK